MQTFCQYIVLNVFLCGKILAIMGKKEDKLNGYEAFARSLREKKQRTIATPLNMFMKSL